MSTSDEWHSLENSLEDLAISSVGSATTTNRIPIPTDEHQAHEDLRIKHKKINKKQDEIDADEPLIDTTEVLPLHSKRLDRRQKRIEQKTKKVQAKQALSSILRLPVELLLQVLTCLEPIDVLRLQGVSRDLQDFIHQHEIALARQIVRQRYWVLDKVFPRPVPLANVDPAAHPALLNTKRQTMLAIHKKSYEHIPVIDMLEFCTCMSCVFAWNNLCTILDTAHWQNNLDHREPIPTIPKGTSPRWNEDLLESHASIVRRSIVSPLTAAAILQRHLQTINLTLKRRAKWHKDPEDIKKRLYEATDGDLVRGTDEHLERHGPHSFEYPFHRDNYYGMDAYIPNRKWSKENHRWLYYSSGQHERDVAWTMDHFS